MLWNFCKWTAARWTSSCFPTLPRIFRVARGSGGGGASEAGDRVINQILTEIDGVGARKSVFVIGATNRLDILDPAIMRPGRLDQLIYIPMPDYESRLSIFRANLRKSPTDDDLVLEHFANITDGFSGADITEVCQRACKLAIREDIAAHEAAEAAAEAAGRELPEEVNDGRLGKKHFDLAMETARKSVSKTELARYLKFKKELSAGGNLKAATEGMSKDDAAPEGDSAEGGDEDLYD